jgi:hypothetical protein
MAFFQEAMNQSTDMTIDASLALDKDEENKRLVAENANLKGELENKMKFYENELSVLRASFNQFQTHMTAQFNLHVNSYETWRDDASHAISYTYDGVKQANAVLPDKIAVVRSHLESNPDLHTGPFHRECKALGQRARPDKIRLNRLEIPGIMNALGYEKVEVSGNKYKYVLTNGPGF